MYKKSMRRRMAQVCVVLLVAAGFLGLIVYRVRVRQFIFYLDARASQDTVRQTGTLPTFASPRIIVSKTDRRLYLMDGEAIARKYRIGLGWSPEGHKRRAGDGRTPEGIYHVVVKNPRSRFHFSLGISYPNAADAAAALEAGIISPEEHDRIVQALKAGAPPPWNTALGGEIFLHGHGASRDWTAGCIALDDAAIEEIYAVAQVGTPVEIRP